VSVWALQCTADADIWESHWLEQAAAALRMLRRSHLILPKIIDVVIHNSNKTPPKVLQCGYIATAAGATVACMQPQPELLAGESDAPQGVVNTSDGRVVRAFHRFTLVDQTGQGRDLTKGRRRDQVNEQVLPPPTLPPICLNMHTQSMWEIVRRVLTVLAVPIRRCWMCSQVNAVIAT